MRKFNVLATKEVRLQDIDTTVVSAVREIEASRVVALVEAYKEVPDEIPPLALLSDERTLIDGLHRLTALKQLGVESVEVEVLDISPDSPEKWRAVIEYNAPALVKILKPSEAIACLRRYLEEAGESVKINELREWCIQVGIPKSAVEDVRRALALKKAVIKPKEAPSPTGVPSAQEASLPREAQPSKPEPQLESPLPVAKLIKAEVEEDEGAERARLVELKCALVLNGLRTLASALESLEQLVGAEKTLRIAAYLKTKGKEVKTFVEVWSAVKEELEAVVKSL